MRTLDPAQSLLLVIDVQARLMPALPDGAAMLRETRRLLDAAALLAVPALVTEQNARGLGSSHPDLHATAPFPKMHFDACREPGFLAALGHRRSIVVAGCEAHVCVLQTTLGLLDAGHHVTLVQDAVTSRTPANKAAALARMAAHGAELVTAEMVIFEWLQTCEHPQFRAALGLVR